MKAYVGTKIILAEPCSERAFVDDRDAHGAFLLSWEKGREDRAGYSVIYEDGYRSWSPKEVFERCYREITKQEMNMLAS